MTKQATSIRLSEQAQADLKMARENYPFLNDSTATIELALWVLARSSIDITAYKPTAARPARAAKKKEQEQ